jgi:ketosteroid isomerase-like protein
MNRQIALDAFHQWMNGTEHVSTIFASDMRWEIVGRSAVAGIYRSRQEFIDEVLAPFGARFAADTPFKPVEIRSVLADGDTVVVVWDGQGTTTAGLDYRNTYAWLMTFTDGLVSDAVAFFDSVAFDELWQEPLPSIQNTPRTGVSIS